MLQWNYYQPTELEKDIAALYRSIGIGNPEDIDPELISARLNIKLLYKDDIVPFFHENNRGRFIGLDKRLPASQQHIDFFHELGHLIRGHDGDQSTLPFLFRELQEEQVEHFIKYALMPYYMIKQLKVPEYERDFPYVIASTFNVQLDLAKERWEQIKRRISTGKWEQECIERERSRYRKTSPANWCPEAKAMFRLAIDGKMKKGQGVIIR
ncbi:ImmA/IrrE family metallo-endopeptidase [Brevibacillus reuszeri]|uniref:ImmA/IrrE family metallo-endopeptidase n=1 Tax=Brevibacillus reuszeri TaxID=54915 RepID=UPI000CCC9786|nr:ImmA/IrrE family metallo-endopeptidase [Brevibacillus reuszeri]